MTLNASSSGFKYSIVTSSNENCFWPFAAGAASASVVWAIAFLIRQRQYRIENSEDGRAKYLLAEYIKSRIGELPNKPRLRMRWPWDRIQRQPRNTSFPNPSHPNLNLDSQQDIDIHEKDDKLGVCIGSIFGLDVGGSLAKLVYFDVNASPRLQSHPHSISHKRSSSSNLGRNGSLKKVTSANSLTDEGTEPKSSELSHMKKCLSMFDLTKSHHHAKALESFYNFVNRLDNYTETGIKDKHLSFYSRALDGEFHFIQFETRTMNNTMDLIKSNNLHKNIVEMGATGGGAHKYADMWDEVLGITMKKTDELESLVAGMQFVLADGNVVGESYTFKPAIQPPAEAESHNVDNSESTTKSQSQSQSHHEHQNGNGNGTSDNPSNGTSSAQFASKTQKDKDPSKPKTPIIHEDVKWTQKVQLDRPLDSSSYPYLVVIIGTGVSVLRVDGPRKYERISGSTIGGGTYLGLCRLLTDMEHYEDVMNLAERGDPSKVDMLVGDIYGENSDALEKLGLPAWLVASSFGKLVTKQDPAAGITQEDLARALLIMVTNNIGQVAYLNAQLHNTSRLYFVGNFLRHNNISQRRLAYAIDYWSKGKMEALFLEHEGYFGALGAFLLSQGIPSEETSLANESIGDSVRRQRSGSISTDDVRPTLVDTLGGSFRRRTNTQFNDEKTTSAESSSSSIFRRRALT